ncbi:uncharacterized protein LOC134534579 [Bacillus rossius redtenbacheri]|uniref:uncharacterized protein LOC134534579 n=1 Tax=Bacillus rossius redtenbacheri TaxID=93214 RepID=UPI002FDE6699
MTSGPRALLVSVFLLAAAASARPDVDGNRLDAGVPDEPRAAASRDEARAAPQDEGWSLLGDLRGALRLYSECGGGGEAAACLKVKLVAAMDRAARRLSGDVELAEGVTLTGEADGDPAPPPPSERQLEAALPRALADKEAALDGMILDRVVGFFSSHSLQLGAATLGGFSEEGRKGGGIGGGGGGGGGGKKGGYGLLLLPLMAFGSLVPLAFAGLFLLAGKALLVSKIALLLSAILGLKKLFSQGGGGGGHESTVVVSGHEHHGRGFGVDGEDPQRLAYRGHLLRASGAVAD